MFPNRKIYQPDGIEIKQSPLHGRGVFAKKEFAAGERIEIAPVILLDPGEREVLQPTALFSYYFLLNSKKKPVALGLGCSSLYNHSAAANAVYMISLKRATITIKAYKKILPGEEITLNYNGIPGDESTVYFSESEE